MPLISDDNRLTIPEELIPCTKLDVAKPIFLYKKHGFVSLGNYFADYFYFSNKKKQKNCLGQIVLDKNLSFDLSENLIGGLKAKKNCLMYVQHRTLILLPRYGNSEYGIDDKFNLAFKPRKCQIPNEMLEITKLDLGLSIFLNGTKDSKFFLSNHISRSCLGIVSLDNENFFTLTENMCRGVKKKIDDSISWVLDKNKIVLN